MYVTIAASVLLSFQAPQPIVALKGPISDIQFSKDGMLVAVAGMQGDIAIFEAGSWAKKHEYKFSGSRVNYIVFSPDNRLVAAASQDNHIRIAAIDGKVKHSLQGPSRGGQGNGICFSPDGSKLVGSVGETILRCWDANTGNVVWSHDTNARGAGNTKWSPTGERIFYNTGGVGGSFVILDRSGKTIAENNGHVGNVRFITFSGDGAYALASVGRGGNPPALIVMDPSSGSTLHNFEADLVDGYFTPDNSLIIGLGGNGELRVFDMVSKGLRYKGNPIMQHQFFMPNRMALSPDGKHVLLAGDVGTGYGFFLIAANSLK